MEDDMADAGDLEIDGGRDILTLPSREKAGFDTDERAVELITIGEADEIRGICCGESEARAQPQNE
jgi:hypothetical protein